MLTNEVQRCVEEGKVSTEQIQKLCRIPFGLPDEVDLGRKAGQKRACQGAVMFTSSENRIAHSWI